MSSIRKKPNSPYWFACICLPGGKRKQFSTGLTDEHEARSAASAAERSFRVHHETPHQLKSALDRLAGDFVPIADSDPGPWLQAWAASRSNETSPRTFAAYTSSTRDAADWLKARGVKTFGSLTPAVLTELRDHWSKIHSGVTTNSKLKHLKIALKAAVSRKLLADNPLADVKNVNEKKTARREFRQAELEVLIPALTGEWKGIFYLGLNTGQRLNDLAELRWSQLDLSSETITFHTEKTDHLVCLPLMQATVNAVSEMPSSDNPDAFVFPGIAAYSRPTRSNQFRSILASVGLEKPVRHDSQKKSGKRTMSALSFHSLRHTATSMLKSAGVSDAIARAIIGHESAAVSRAYTHLDMATMKAAMEKMGI